MRSSEKIFWGWGRSVHKKLGTKRCWYCPLWNQSRSRISKIGALSSESMGRSGSQGWNYLESSKLETASSRKIAQEIAKKLRKWKRICCEVTDRARQLRIDKLSMQQERNPSTVSQLLTQHSGFAEQSEFLDLTILRQRAALEHPTFPANPWIFRVPEVRFAAIRDCRSIHGIPWVLQETFLKAYLLEKDLPQLPSRIDGIWHHLLVDWHQEILWNMEEEWDEIRRVL